MSATVAAMAPESNAVEEGMFAGCVRARIGGCKLPTLVQPH